MRVSACALTILVSFTGLSAAGATLNAKVAQRDLPGTNCPAFPADNVWNTPITGLPVNANSATWLASMDSSSTYLHPDYGPSGNPQAPYGIPWQIVPAGTPFTRVTFLYAQRATAAPTRSARARHRGRLRSPRAHGRSTEVGHLARVHAL